MNQDNSEVKGKIFSVGKSFENDTKSVAVHANISNNQQKLIPGMYVNALIDVGSNNVKALPNEAIIKADGREFIFVLEEGHKKKKKKLTMKKKGIIMKTDTNTKKQKVKHSIFNVLR